MIAFSCVKGKRLALFGLGGSGLAAAKACIAGGAELTVWDDRPQAVAEAAALGFTVKDLRALDWSGISALVLSPGVPLTHPEPHWSVALARQAGAEIIGDIELFARERALFLSAHKGQLCPVVAITGTNGKSTTTALIAHMLAAAGRDAQMGGNIGKPVAELEAFAAAGSRQVYVLELSSYQIDLTPSLKPAVGILLNITPDHIDRHGSFANYAAVKEALIARARQAVVALDDAPCQAVYDRLQKAGRKPAAIKADNNGGYETAPAAYRWHSGEFWQGEAALPAAAVLHSRHNAQNALCALAACAALGARGFERGLSDFKGLPHRMEELGSAVWHGVKLRFINDSKATNAESAAPALQSFQNIYWLAGGRAKAGGIASLMRPQMLANIRGCYFFGEAEEEFTQTAAACPTRRGHLPRGLKTLAAAFAQALRDAQADCRSGALRGEAVILLSPACASFDRFKNFEERGKAFAALAQKAMAAPPEAKPKKPKA